MTIHLKANPQSLVSPRTLCGHLYVMLPGKDRVTDDPKLSNCDICIARQPTPKLS